MALPKQVQAQLAEVEELEKTLEARRSPPKDTDTGDKGQSKVLEDGAGEDTPTPDPEPKAAEAPKPEKAKPADTSPPDVEASFEQKYRTLRGKYDAEVPRLIQQNRDLVDRNLELEKQLKAQSQPEQPTKAKEKVSYVTDADREEFGEELIEVQRRVAREVADEFQDKLEAQAKVIEELKNRLGETDGKVVHMTFAQKLAQLVPDFEQVDNDPRWIAWLGEFDPMLRGPRRDRAQAAFNAGDADAVADYVKLFKQSIAETPKPTEDSRQTELEKQVAPNRTASSSRAQTTGKEPRVWREREVQDAWQKIRVLNTRGNVDEAAKLEAELTAAYLEGRVRA